MVDFTIKHVNRLNMFDKHILIVEDDLLQQARFAKYFLYLLGHQSNVRVNLCATAIDAFNLLSNSMYPPYTPSLYVIDHDLQYGNGRELIKFIRNMDLVTPIITASGIPANNVRMMEVGASHSFTKEQVLQGKAEHIIREALGNVNYTKGWEHIEC